MEIDRTQSEFNSTLEWLKRIDTNFVRCMIARTDRNSFEWSNALLALYDELCTEMKDSEKEELYPKIKELCDKSNVKPGRQQQGIPPDFFWEMNNVELRLRAIFDKSGLQKRVKQDPGSAIGAVS